MGYRRGDFKRVCDECGFVVYASQTRKRWDGLIVCEADWEPRHPQDFVKARRDRQIVPDPRPEPADRSVGPAGGPWFLVEGPGYINVSDGQFFVFGAADNTVTADDF